MSETGGVPAPGRSDRFSPDEVIVYGVLVNGAGVASITIVNGGTGYAATTRVEFKGDGKGGKAKATIGTGGVISGFTDLKPGFGYDNPPEVEFYDVGTGKDADVIAILEPRIAKLNLEGRWDLEVKATFKKKKEDKENDDDLRIVAAYGYAFEGHCYRFDKTRILGFEARPGELVNLGCGFDPPEDRDPGWYRMWRIMSFRRIIELNTSAGTVEEIILAANLPGRQSPNTYRADTRIAHRGGRLTGPGI